MSDGPRRPAGLPGWALGLAGLAGLCALLELVPRLGLVPARYLPPLSQIVAALAEQAHDGAFWAALGDTLRGWALGLAIALALGVALGLLIGASERLRAATNSTVEFLRPIPSVALIPLAVLLYGTDIRSKLLLIVYASFWQVLIQVIDGVQDVDPVARETARSYRLGAWAQLRHVTWPSALPYVLTGVRLAATVALVLAITAELIIGSPGLGKQIAVAQSSGAVAAMYALVIVTGLVGVAVNVLARALERRVLAWHTSVRADVPV
jgi:ABC-type nitrate/sulfonate/bicarbonate transport system permease component